MEASIGDSDLDVTRSNTAETRKIPRSLGCGPTSCEDKECLDPCPEPCPKPYPESCQRLCPKCKTCEPCKPFSPCPTYSRCPVYPTDQHCKAYEDPWRCEEPWEQSKKPCKELCGKFCPSCCPICSGDDENHQSFIIFYQLNIYEHEVFIVNLSLDTVKQLSYKQFSAKSYFLSAYYYVVSIWLVKLRAQALFGQGFAFILRRIYVLELVLVKNPLSLNAGLICHMGYHRLPSPVFRKELIHLPAREKGYTA